MTGTTGSVVHYPVTIHIDGHSRWVLWWTDDAGPDGVVCAGPQILSFSEVDGLRAYAIEHGLELLDEIATFDFDAAVRWDDEPPVKEILNCRNLVNDVALSIGLTFDDRSEEKDRLYDKVFWGNNLPSMTPPGERFEPTWSQNEVELLQGIIGDGTALIRRAL